MIEVPAWSEFAIVQVPQWFDAIPGKVTRYDIQGLSKIASNPIGDEVLTLIPETAEVVIQRAGRFTIFASTYVQGSIENGDPNFTIDVMGAIVFRIPDNPIPNL